MLLPTEPQPAGTEEALKTSHKIFDGFGDNMYSCPMLWHNRDGCRGDQGCVAEKSLQGSIVLAGLCSLAIISRKQITRQSLVRTTGRDVDESLRPRSSSTNSTGTSQRGREISPSRTRHSNSKLLSPRQSRILAMRCLTFFILVIVGGCAAGAWENGLRCPSPSFPNGRVRARSKGKIVRFTCYEGYTLVGNKYSTCIRGKWDTPIPVCVNSQCPTPAQPEHSLIATKYNGAVSMYFCEPGYILVGASEIYCNGRKWNATVPYCRDSTAAAPTVCDFEKSDLCWWEQDPTHDFDWLRHNHDTPSSHIGTGPSHDHTLGPGYDGYYLYIEASGRLVNDTARIVSPLYNASFTERGCFSFWYHMYGATIGALKVYFKPERAVPQLMFEKEGNQGNQWLHGYFYLPSTNDTSFQIIIEGVRGASYVSDMAVDDVAILVGDACSFVATTVRPEVINTNDDQIEMVNALQSCRGRCGSGPPSRDAAITVLPSDSPDACHCNLDCAQTSICCPDFAEYCILGVTDAITSIVDEATISASIPNKPIPINPKDDIDPYAKVTQVNTAITAATATMLTGEMAEVSVSLGTRSYITPRTTTRATSIVAPIEFQTTTKNFTSDHAETPFPTTTMTWQDSRVSARTEAHVRIEQATLGQLDSSMSFGTSGIAAIVVVIASVIVLTTIVAYVLLRRRKSYKGRAGGGGSALSEDSDVRYLTSDEILDFNLARPSEYDQI